MLLWLGMTGRGEEGAVRIRLAIHDAQRLLHAQLGWPLPGTPDLAQLNERLAGKGLARGNPVFIRIFKREQELELWMKKGGSFVLFASYPICRYSGELGPKRQEGDFQAPEGFYSVARAQLNPRSSYRRSFNLGFPNLYDAANGRTGSFVMVHGACMSAGCYAMTDPVIDEILGAYRCRSGWGAEALWRPCLSVPDDGAALRNARRGAVERVLARAEDSLRSL